MDEGEIKQLLAGSVADVSARLADLDRATLVELQAAEVAGANRSTLLAALDKQLAALDELPASNDATNPTGGGDGKGTAAASAAAAAPADPPAWQAPDYTGPLTGDQADWRVHHTKPAKAGAAK